MSAKRWELEDATTWFTGSRGESQSCDDVCAAALCGVTREDECPETPTCVSEALEALWADSACTIHTDARADAGAVALLSCSECGPSDYSNAYCFPGIINDSPGTAYYGRSTSGSSAATLCAVLYTDARTEPLCPCLLPALEGGLGWAIVIGISVASAVYVTGGVAYGRYKNPPSSGAKSLSMSHPNGEPAMNWHPHRSHWGELVELCYDGIGLTMAKWRKFRGDSDASYSPIGDIGDNTMGQDSDSASELEKQRKQRRRSEPTATVERDAQNKKKKKKKKPKPRPSRRSLPAQLDEGTKEWLKGDDSDRLLNGGDTGLE